MRAGRFRRCSLCDGDASFRQMYLRQTDPDGKLIRLHWVSMDDEMMKKTKQSGRIAPIMENRMRDVRINLGETLDRVATFSPDL